MSDFPIAPTPKPSKFDLELEAQRAEPGAFGKWLEQNPPPSFAELADKAGGFHLISAQAWREFDARMEAWKQDARLRGGLLPIKRGK